MSTAEPVSETPRALIIDEPGYTNSRETVVEVLLKDADEVEKMGFIAKAYCYRAAAKTIAALSRVQAPAEPLSFDKAEQAMRCSCRGSDDLCPCQNVADATTRREADAS